MITEEMLAHLRSDLEKGMEPSRYLHTLGVEREVRELARFFLPEGEMEAAAVGLLHDVTKGWSVEAHHAFCKAKRCDLTADEWEIPALLHSKTAALLIPDRYPFLATEGVISAIKKHTAAAREMSVLDALLYLADITEDGRTYPSCRALRQELHEGMRKTDFLRFILLHAYDSSLSALEHSGRRIAASTLEARKALLENEKYFS